MKKMIFIILLLTGYFKCENMSLQQCIDYALSKNKELLVLKNNYESSKAKTQEVTSIYWPQISASYQINRTDTPLSQSFGNAFSGFSNIPNDLDNTVYSLGLGITQTIWDFGRTSALENKSRLDEDVASIEYNKKKLEISYKVKKDCFSILQAKATELTAKTTAKEMLVLLDSIKAKKEQGLATELDVLNAESAYLRYNLEEKKATHNIEISEISLKNDMNKDDNEPVELGNLDFPKPSKEPLGFKSFEEAKENALSERLDYKSQQIQEEIAKIGINGSYADWWPTLSGSVNYEYSGSDISIKDHSWSYGLVLNLPIFTGFNKFAKLQESQILFENSELNKKILESSIVLQVKDNYYKVLDAEEDYSVTLNKENFLKMNLDAVNAKYEQGMATINDLIEAQTKKSNSEFETQQSLFSYETALNELENSIGGLK